MNTSLNEILSAIRAGDDRPFGLLCERYAGLVDAMVRQFQPVVAGTDRDDLRQETVMALYRAAASYDPEKKGVTFGLYARICIRNRLISLKRASDAARRRREKLHTGTPRMDKERKARFVEMDWESPVAQRLLSALSPLERKVLPLYVRGLSYREIAQTLSLPVKSVDNTIMRIKKKLRAFFAL